jgi:hypothetical protein
VAERPAEQVPSVFTCKDGPVASTAGIAAVCYQLGNLARAEQPAGEPIVGEAHRSRAGRVCCFVLRKPSQSGHGMERLRYESNSADPFPSARLTGTPFGHQVKGSPCGARIIPQDRRPNDVSDFVEADHAVLLGSHRKAVHVIDSARRLDRLAEVIEEGMLLIGADVNAEVIGPKTFIERNAYLISVHQLVQPFVSRIGRRPGSGTSTSTCLTVLSPAIN